MDDTTLRRKIGYAIQNVGLFPHMTVRDNIATVPRLQKWKTQRIEERIVELMDMVELPLDYLSKYPIHLSGGEAQRVGVARALAADPKILLMDEPLCALDPMTRKKLQEELLSIQDRLQKTILFVTHDIMEALFLADEVVLMKEKQIVMQDTPLRIIQKSRKIMAEFSSGGFALDLLEKYTIRDIVKDLPIISDGANQNAVSSHTSLKQVLEEMVLTGAPSLITNHNGCQYRLDFHALKNYLRGENHD